MKCLIKDIEVNYEIIGAGKAILMLNGNGVDMRSMIHCMEPLFEGKPGWKRIYVDQPGVGGTKAAEWIESSDDVLNILLEFLHKIIPGERFSVAGRSYGGYLALGLLNYMRDVMDGLLLICPANVIDREKRDIDKGIDYIKNIDLERERIIERRVAGELEAATQLTNWSFLDKLREHIEFSFDVNRYDKSFDKPILILTGKQDDVTGYRDTFELLNGFPRATFCVLDKAGHIPQIEQEELFNALVKEWLYRVEEEIRR